MTPAESKVRQWREDARVFVREVLHAEPDAWQDETLEAVSSPRQRFALKASKGPGKSTVLAWIGWWYLLTRPHPKCVATSISGDNLHDNLWTEFAKWRERSKLLLHTFEWTSNRIFSRGHPKTWWMSARTWPKDADTQKQSETLAGIHADHVLFLIDEVGGIPDAVVATAEAGLANSDLAAGREAKLFIAGNPTHTSGPLWRACGRERDLWWVKEISGDPDDPKRASRVSKQWAEEQIRKYGRDNPWVLVNVFGKFPPGQSNTLIGVQEASDAAARKFARAQYVHEVKVLGVDCARYGDDRSIIYPRQGPVAFKPKVLRKLDTMQLASQVALVIDTWKPDATFIDMATFGAGTYDRLLQLGYSVVGVDSGHAADEDRKFHNKRAECWWRMAEWLKAGGGTPDDAELITELSSPTFKFDEQNRIQLEKKVEVKKRLGVSPDKADALAFTFAQPVAHAEVRKRWERQKSRVVHEHDPYAEGA